MPKLWSACEAKPSRATPTCRGHAEALERRSKATGDNGVRLDRLNSRGGVSMEEHGKLWAIATLLFVIAIIGYVLQD
jgi:hypothetical protein